MSFLHPALLAMAALAALPVILHLIMRPKPKRFLFPALRLIESRRKSNVRRLRLRHIWLLLLRILIIVLIVLAVARPVVPAAHYGLTTVEMLLLGGIAIVCLAAYFAALRFWTRPAGRSDFLYRRALLRGGSGSLAALLVLLLVAWPYARRISAEVTNPGETGPSEDRPVAAVFMFDTSRSMEYQRTGQTRLERAKQIALAHLATLPSGSRVAVGTSSEDQPIVFQADLAGARERIEDLETRAVSHALEQRVRGAFDAQAGDRKRGLADQLVLPEDQRRDHFARAVYLFTDLAESAWTGTRVKTLRERLEMDEWLQMFVVDVGVEEPINVGLVGANPSVEVATTDAPLSVRSEISVVGDPSDVTVELYVDGAGGPVKRGQSTIRAEPGQPSRIPFPIAAPSGGVIQGELRILRGDPYSPDNVRYFTITVDPPPRVLVVSDESLDGRLWAEALRARGYDVADARSVQLGTERLESYAAVYLINVTRPSAETWERLGDYVRAGGGLGVILGTRVDPLAYDLEQAQAVLPAKILAQIAFPTPEFFRPIDDGHPVFAKFADFGGYGWLTNRDVRRHYVVEPDDEAAVIAKYTYSREDRPALVLRTIDSGRVALLTTGVDSTEGWSDLPKADWQFLALADQLTRFISGRSGGKRNFIVGEPATIRFSNAELPEQVLLRTPKLEQRPIPVKESGRVVIDRLDEVGSYTLSSPPDGPELHGGLSANLPPGESDFTKLDEAELDGLFGEDRYQIAEDAQSLEIVVRDATLGAEFMPYVVMLLVLVFCGEQFVSNRFYDQEQSPERD